MRPPPRRSPEAGFSLLALIVVVAVLGVLAAIVAPTCNGVVNRSRDAALERELESLGRAAAVLADLDGDEATAAHLAETVTSGQAAAGVPLAAGERWTAYLDVDALDPLAVDELAVTESDGRIGAATSVPHRDGYAAFLVVSTTRVTAELADLAGTSDGGSGVLTATGAGALCFFGMDDSCDDQSSTPPDDGTDDGTDDDGTDDASSPAVPSGVEVTAGDGQLHVSWGAVVDADGYRPHLDAKSSRLDARHRLHPHRAGQRHQLPGPGVRFRIRAPKSNRTSPQP